MLIVAILACGPQEQPPIRAGAPDHVPEGLNAAQNEMLLLEQAMHVTVTGVARGDTAEVPEAFHRVHQARALTVEAVEAGRWKPPLHADQLPAFEAMDGAFHDDVEALVTAAAANDVAATARQAGALLVQCAACHAQFRPPAASAGHPPPP